MFNLDIDKRFFKNFKKLDIKTQNNIKILFIDLKNTTNLYLFSGIKEISGYKGYFRIRFGDLRIGLYKNGNNLEIYYIGNRGDFYKKFPKHFR